MSLRKIINLTKNKNRIVKNLHNESDYKDKKSIY